MKKEGLQKRQEGPQQSIQEGREGEGEKEGRTQQEVKLPPRTFTQVLLRTKEHS